MVFKPINQGVPMEEISRLEKFIAGMVKKQTLQILEGKLYSYKLIRYSSVLRKVFHKKGSLEQFNHMTQNLHVKHKQKWIATFQTI